MRIEKKVENEIKRGRGLERTEETIKHQRRK